MRSCAHGPAQPARRLTSLFFPRSKKRAAIEEAPAGADDSTVSAASVAGLSKNQKKKLAKKQKGEDGAAVEPAAAAAPAPAAAPAKKAEKAAAPEPKKVCSPLVSLS